MKKVLLSTSGVILGASLLITGCANKEEVAKSSNVYMDQEFQGAPSWVLMPVVEGYIAEVGSAQRNAANDIAFQRTEAMANARDNLAKQISINVDTMFKSFKAATGSGVNATFDRASENVSKQIASQVLNNTIAKDIWISKSGNMYVLMIIDTKSVANQAENAIKTSFNNDEALYQKFLAAKAQESLEQELEKRNK